MVTSAGSKRRSGLDHCPVTVELDDVAPGVRMAVGWSRKARSRRPLAAPWRWGGREGGA